MAAFIIATGAAASGMDVTMFFTFWGLQAIKKPSPTGRSLFGRMLGVFLRDIQGVGPSKMNFGGLGRWMFKKMMKAHNVTPLPELRRPRGGAGRPHAGLPDEHGGRGDPTRGSHR